MSGPALEVTGDPGVVWRVGFQPDPWGWPDWKYAEEDGRFDGRWDDERRQFRTLYTAESLFACLVELLARLRPHPGVDGALLGIEDPDDQGALYTDHPAGTVSYTWLEDRRAGHAVQTGRYCYVTHSNSVAVLRQHFTPEDFGSGSTDLDTALLKDLAPRRLTRSIARWLYEQHDPDGTDVVDGVEFRSRHGDDLRMWAVFERGDDSDISPHLEQRVGVELAPDTPALIRAFALHGLTWVAED